ncbi:MAG: hypothetical protein JWQ35_2775 [Bacteriovoracaceae bacterium]|nr:hypothetical protein [Bacteriovoracaceae bacterium]
MNTKQYTIRNVPERVDLILKRKAKREGRSLNDIALEALSEGSGDRPTRRADMDFLRDSLSSAEARQLEATILAQRTIDGKLWK